MQKPEPNTFWRHYKSTGGIDHLYKVIGIAIHSETDQSMVIYVPQYQVPPDSWAYGYNFVTRPLSMWHDAIDWHDKKVPRFTQIPASEIASL